MGNNTYAELKIVLAIALLGLNLVLFNFLLDGTRFLRQDLTDGQYFTLTEPTRELLADLEDPIEIHLYTSPLENQPPVLRPVIEPLKDILREFDAQGGEKVRLRLVDLEKAGKEEQSKAEKAFGVRYYPFEFQDATSTGLRNTYFSLVVISGDQFEEIGLGSREDVTALFRIRAQANETVVELNDVEYLLASTIQKLTQGFDSAAGALAARDQKAKVTYVVTAPETLPETLKGAKEAFEKVAQRITKESAGRFESVVLDPFAGIADLPEAAREGEKRKRAKKLYEDFGVEIIPGGFLSKEPFASWLVFEVAGSLAPVELLPRSATIGESDVKEAIEGALKQLIPGFLPVVGISSPTPAADPMMMRMGQRPPPDEFQGVSGSLRGSYEVETVDLAADPPRIPASVKTLILIRPNSLSDAALYAVDQFVMRGGNLVACVDNFSIDLQKVQATGLGFAEQNTESVRKLLAHYGAEIATDALLDEQSEYLSYVTQEGMSYVTKREYIPTFVRFRRSNLDDKNPVTASLEGVTMMAPSPVTLKSPLPNGVQGTVLASTSAKATSTSSAVELMNTVGPKWNAPGDSRSYSVAIALEGRFQSYFADKPIPTAKKPEEGAEEPATGEPKADDPVGGVLKASRRSSRIVVVGDSDFLSYPVFATFLQDRTGEILGTTSLRLIQNAIDWGGDSEGLLKIRSRLPARRPLEALRGLDETARDKKTYSTMAWTLASTLGALALMGGGWMVYRSTRPAMELLPVSSNEELGR